jgi:elongation factor 3
MISHNEEFVGALCPEQWHVADGRLTHKGHMAVNMDRFEDSRPGSSAVSSAMQSAAGSPMSSAAPSNAATPVGSDNEGPADMKFKAKKKKVKLTRTQQKEREVRRRMRYIEWLNSPKGTPQPPNSDDES